MPTRTHCSDLLIDPEDSTVDGTRLVGFRLKQPRLAGFHVGCQFRPTKDPEKPVDPNLVGVWQYQNDAKEIWTVRADGTLRWFYQGVPAIGISDSIVEYTYRADPTKSA